MDLPLSSKSPHSLLIVFIHQQRLLIWIFHIQLLQPVIWPMESISSTASLFTPTFKCFDPSNLYFATFDSRNSSVNYSPGLKSRATKTNGALTMDGKSQLKIVTGEAGFVLEDVPHLSDYIQDLPVLLFLPLALLPFLLHFL